LDSSTGEKQVAEYIEVEQAIATPGLRVVLTTGVPGPWGEAAKGILRVKKIPYTKVAQRIGDDSTALIKWTAQNSAPVFMYNDERPRSVWLEQLGLAQRLAPEPNLVPSNIKDRMLMFGLSNELCGENGLGWSRRLMMIHKTISNPDVPEAAKQGSLALISKYGGYNPGLAAQATEHVAEILRTTATQLASQQAKGARFLIGDRLSALDIYWAAFCALIKPLPDELCKISPAFRRMYHCTEPAVVDAATPQLLAHRDFIYREYLELPIDM
jgi:glutathione S-transferase